jgi:hypothetical protein
MYLSVTVVVGTNLVIWPSFSRIVFICDRKSGSNVAGV